MILQSGAVVEGHQPLRAPGSVFIMWRDSLVMGTESTNVWLKSQWIHLFHELMSTISGLLALLSPSAVFYFISVFQLRILYLYFLYLYAKSSCNCGCLRHTVSILYMCYTYCRTDNKLPWTLNWSTLSVCQVSTCKDTTISWTKMASYFDEHDCEPTNPEEQYRQNALLELARWDETYFRCIILLFIDAECWRLWLTAGLYEQVSDAGPGLTWLRGIWPVRLGPTSSPSSCQDCSSDSHCSCHFSRASR